MPLSEWEVKDGLYIDKWHQARMLMKDLGAEPLFEYFKHRLLNYGDWKP